jgi:heme/copper-type cytochrome/quinol oxidase subunit 2
LEEKMPRLGLGQIILLIALFAILALAVSWAAMVWNTGENHMDKHGWIALGLGTFFSLVIGCGLMALMFFSQRSGHDDAADPFRKREERDREV